MKITVLGNSSASPRANRHPSAHVVCHQQHLFLVDCGEATQFQLIKYKIKYSQIDHIFISHLHGDHFFGIMGLLITYYLNNRSRPLHIYANKELENFINLMLQTTNTCLNFEILYHYLKPGVNKLILETDQIKVSAFPLCHRVPTHGFVFEDKFNSLNSFAYCSDTNYCPEIIPFIKNVGLLYHEATYGDEKEISAKNKYHSTARQAAQIAKLSQVSKLIIGHFSAKYTDLSELLLQAKEEFLSTEIAQEGKDYEVL